MIKWMTCCAFPDTSNRDTAGKMPLHRRVLKASYSPARQVTEECVNDRSFHAKLRSYVPVAFLTPAARSFFLVSANHTRASTKVKDGNLQERIIGLAYSRWHPERETERCLRRKRYIPYPRFLFSFWRICSLFAGAWFFSACQPTAIFYVEMLDSDFAFLDSLVCVSTVCWGITLEDAAEIFRSNSIGFFISLWTNSGSKILTWQYQIIYMDLKLLQTKKYARALVCKWFFSLSFLPTRFS